MVKRKINKLTKGVKAIDGAGVHLVRVFGHSDVYDYDPFLLLDAFDSKNPNDYIKGFPWHPHRGIETITYLIEGEIEHGDSLGNKGMIKDGECQWMTAGSGIIHQEMPQASPRMLGAQIWLNLPSDEKMTIPLYGDIKHQDIPKVEDEDKKVFIVSGEYEGVQGGFEAKFVKATYLDVSLQQDKEFSLQVPHDNTLFIYLISGKLQIDQESVEHRTSILFTHGDHVSVTALEPQTRFLLLHAKPLRQPIHWGGPIVMSSRQDLVKAFDELNQGTFIK